MATQLEFVSTIAFPEAPVKTACAAQSKILNWLERGSISDAMQGAELLSAMLATSPAPFVD